MFSIINSFIQYLLDIKLKYPLLFLHYKKVLLISGILVTLILGCIGFIPVWIGTIGQLLGGIGLSGAAYIAYKRLIHDAQRTALFIDIDSNVITEIDDLTLIAFNIKLYNKGVKRIYARMYRDVEKDRKYLFAAEEGVDICMYAGTLKIRKVPSIYNDVKLTDWYSLEPITDQLIVKDLKAYLGDFEQINYLDDFGIPTLEGGDRDVNFFVEANEEYSQQVVVMLPPGLYGVKAFFLGRYQAKYYDEYWSCTKMINI